MRSSDARFGAILVLWAAPEAFAASSDRDPASTTAAAAPGVFIEEMTIIGTRETRQQITGAADLISPEDLARFEYGDVQRVLRQAPGVSLQIEDGFGLRPNISIRAVPAERSARITLLEDNVLIAPAPYAAPAAYYFPTPGRMHSFEVLKGPSAITQGPYTIGGALNMVSTPVPETAAGSVFAEGGEDSSYRVHAHYGARLDNGFGFMAETHQWGSDGYQDIDRSSRDTGLSVQDYTLKLLYAPVASRHRVELKLQYADQGSDQSYLGLTDVDFDNGADRRYGLSELDNIDSEHEQIVLRYEFAVTDALTLGATGYDNDHKRDWFKTEGIDFDGSTSAEDFSRTSWFDVVQAINLDQPIGAVTPETMQGILDGTVDTAPGALQMRSNKRKYYSKGVQTFGRWQARLGPTSHELEFGVRYHEDQEDRLQRNSTFTQTGGELFLDDPGLLGNAGNQVQDAKAWSGYVYDRIELGRWTVSPGLRYEDIEQKQRRWETRPGLTTDPASRDPDNLRDAWDNHVTVWLPGIGVLYRVTDSLSLLAGVHRGFSAPPNVPGVDEEKADNYEYGLRYRSDLWHADVIGFYTEYDNLLGICTNSSGGNCEVGDAFNGDAATVKGLELQFGIELAPSRSFSVPFSLTYTYTDSRFENSFDSEYFGPVSDGDPIPYLPDNQLLARLGFQRGRVAADVSANYVEGVCTQPACGPFQKTDDSLTWDLSASYTLSGTLELFGRLENLGDADDIMGRQPYGARPNRPRTAAVGVRFDF